jgi:hypothetical protein
LPSEDLNTPEKVFGYIQDLLPEALKQEANWQPKVKFLLDLLSRQLNAVLSEEETKKFLYDSLQLFRLLSEELSQGFQLMDVVELMGQTDVLRFTCEIVTKYLLRRECTVCELLKDQAMVFLVHFTVYDSPLPCQMLCHS